MLRCWPLASVTTSRAMASRLRVLDVGEGRLGDGLAGVLRQHRLGVEALQVADAAVHEQPDDALGLGREVRPAVGRRPVALARVAVAVQHGPERQR